MTAARAAATRPVPVRPGHLRAAGRLLRLELRRGAMLWVLPVPIALFWLITYRKVMAMPPLWNLRTAAMQSGALADFVMPVADAAAWMGSREGRRHTTDLVAVTARPRWARLLATWGATTCWAAAAITVTTASPLGEPERVAGRWLPFLRLAFVLALTAAAAGVLAAAGTGAHLAGGTLDVLRNLAGMTGLGLLCAAALGGGLAWTGPLGYLVAGVYGLYTQWHGPPLTTPWLWPARPPHDVGAAICAGLVFTLGTAAITVHGARDSVRETA